MSRITEAKRQQALGMRLEGVTAAAIFSFLLTTATPTANARGLSPTSRLRAVTPPTTAPLPRVATLFQQHSNALNARRAVSPVLRRVDPHGLGVGSASSRAAPKTTSPTRPQQQQHPSASTAAAPPTAIVATTSTSSPTRRGLSPPLAQTSLRFHGPASSNGGGAAAAVTTSTTPKRSSTTTTVTVPSPSSSLRGGGPPPPPALVVSSPSHHTPLGGRPSSASTPGRMLSPGSSSSSALQLGRGRSPPRHHEVLLASPGSLGAVLHSSGGGSAVARTVSPTRASRWLEDFRYRLQSEGFDEGAWRQLTRGERDEWYLSWRLPQLQVCLLEREFGEGGGAPPSA